MDSFLQRFAGRIKGVLTGFDRIVFKGCIRPLMLAEGAMAFLRARGVLDKWMLAQSAALCAAAERAAQRRCGRGVEPASPIGPATTPRRGIRSGLGSTAGASIYTSTTTIRGTASPASGGRRGFPTASRSRSTAASGCAARSTGSASPTWFMATSSCTLPITSGRNGCRRGRTMRAGRRRQGPRVVPRADRPALHHLRGHQPPTPADARPVCVGRRPNAAATLRTHHPASHASASARHPAQAAQPAQLPAHR